MSHVNVLDTTLRDGSYTVNFAFTAEDTGRICRALESAGFRYIEVGHGMGLGAERRGRRAGATDREYARAAREALSEEAMFCMFCIPGVGSLDDLAMVADHGMPFIRIGTDVTAVATAQPYIEEARRRGMLVAFNLMKSYTISPTRFAEEVRRTEEWGAQIAYLVDSAGCMLPEEVVEYHDAVREVSDIPVGFHGHDNLGMAGYNSLRMVDAGATFVDSSLQGLGRGAGNAVSESLIAALHKRGYSTGVDLLETLRAGYKLVRPLREGGGIMPLDVVAGYAGFHSSYLPQVLDVARRRGVDPARLIIEICQVDRVGCGADMVEAIAGRIGDDSDALSYLGEYGDLEVEV